MHKISNKCNKIDISKNYATKYFGGGSKSRLALNKLIIDTPLSTLYNSLILKGLKFNNFLAKNCKPSIYRALEKRVESQVIDIKER